MKGARGAPALGVLIAAVIAVGAASAMHAVRRTDGVIHACRAKNGTLRVVRDAQTPIARRRSAMSARR